VALWLSAPKANGNGSLVLAMAVGTEERLLVLGSWYLAKHLRARNFPRKQSRRPALGLWLLAVGNGENQDQTKIGSWPLSIGWAKTKNQATAEGGCATRSITGKSVCTHAGQSEGLHGAHAAVHKFVKNIISQAPETGP
jgi:hypothetical protein